VRNSTIYSSTLHNVYLFGLFALTLQYDDYIIYCNYDTQPNPFLIYGVALLEASKHPLSIDLSKHSLFVTLQAACSTYVSIPRNHVIFQLTLTPSWRPHGLTHSKPTPYFRSNKASLQLSLPRTNHSEATRITTLPYQLMTIGDKQGLVTSYEAVHYVIFRSLLLLLPS
jgi:hypothetical protein